MLQDEERGSRPCPVRGDGLTESFANASIKPASNTLRAWEDLNARQRAFLEAVYRADKREEAFQRSAFSRGLKSRPADEWRWMLFHSGHSPIPTRLLELRLLGLLDPGAGSTFAALERRGLLLTENRRARTRLGVRERLHVRLTTAGRKAARAGLGESGPKRLPPGASQHRSEHRLFVTPGDRRFYEEKRDE